MVLAQLLGGGVLLTSKNAANLYIMWSEDEISMPFYIFSANSF